jgi:hypothetical protein
VVIRTLAVAAVVIFAEIAKTKFQIRSQTQAYKRRSLFWPPIRLAVS